MTSSRSAIRSADRQDIRKVHAVIREFLPNRGFISSAYQGELLRPEMLIEVEANAYKAETAGVD